MQINRNQNYNRFKKNEPQHKINNAIVYPEVRVIIEGEEPRILSSRDAIKLADEMGLDLIEISAVAKPPVCKIMDYSKYLYQLKKAEKDKQKKNRENRIDLKELQFSPSIAEHDINVRIKQAERFLTDGDKVKAVIKFKGREIVYKDKGSMVLLQFAEKLFHVGKVEQMPKLEGKKIFMVIAPL